MSDTKDLTPEELKARLIRFFDRYGAQLDQIAELLRIALTQLSLAYTIEQKLPPEAVRVSTRVKKLPSALKKLKADGWPQFYYPTEVIKDLVGARVVCWFVDDCYGLQEFVERSGHFRIADKKINPVKDYIANPKAAGYRGIHVFADISYDGVKRVGEQMTIAQRDILCEIQIRSKLQDAWGDITHEFFYKAKHLGVENPTYEQFLADLAKRLSVEDGSLMKFRDAYQELADQKTKDGTREGLRDEDE